MSLRSDTLATEQQILAMIRSMEQLRCANYITASTVVFMLYDIIINLEREIPLVWYYGEESDSANPHYQLQAQARKVKQSLRGFSCSADESEIPDAADRVMFTINNTTGLPTALCKRYYYYLNLAGPVLYVTVVNIILAMRVRALNKRQRYFGAFLAFLVVGEILVDFAVCTVMSVRIEAQVVNPPRWIPWPGCMLASRNTPLLTLASWLTALFVSTVFCAVTLKNILFPEQENLSLEEMLRLPPRTRVMLYDGVAVYFLTFAIVLVSTVVLSLVQNELSTLVVSLLVGIYSHCASRLILNVREIENKLCPADVPDDPDLLPPLPFLTLPRHDEQPVASSSRI